MTDLLKFKALDKSEIDTTKSSAGSAQRDGANRRFAKNPSKVGDVLKEQGDVAAALTSFSAALTIIERMATADPNNAGWQYDLSASYVWVGNVLVAQVNLAAALNRFTASFAIAERLAKADPHNAGWQRHLAISYADFADLHRRAGEHNRALDALRDGRAIMQQVVSRSPDDAKWKEDLTWFDAQIAGPGK
jgi:Flp pilus assembly protein TadD